MKHFQPILAAGGLVDMVCELIGELKRSEIWPEEFHRACTARGIGEKDRELFEIYEAYQQRLREHGLFDAEGRFWSARDELRKAEHSALFARLVVVNGFTDFTRTQHEIIELLAARAAETIITLPLESEPRRGDLFAKPLKTLAELRRRHGDRLAIEELPRRPRSQWPAMAQLERNLLVNPRAQRRDGPAFPVAEKGADPGRALEHRNPGGRAAGGRNRVDRRPRQAAAG